MLKVEYRGNPDYSSDFAYQTAFSSGADLVAQEDIVVYPGEVTLVKTGVYVVFPESCPTGKIIPEFQVRARSGLAFKYGIMLVNGVGSIDIDYKNEIGVLLTTCKQHSYTIGAGDRVAQLVGAYSARIDNVPVKSVERTGGFGSTSK